MNITFWTTMDCNLNCKYCYNRASNNIKKEYMTADVIYQGIKLITALPQFNTDEQIYINFHGGEPLMNCDAIELIMDIIEKCIPRTSITYGLTTNGTLSSDKQLKILNKIDNISVSIDGNEKNHNRYRIYTNGCGSFDKVIETAKKLHKIKTIRVRTTITPKTLSSMSDIVCFLIEEGFKEIVPVLDMFDKRWKDEDENLIFLEFRKIKEYLENKNCDDVSVGWVSKSPITKKGVCDGGVTSFHILPSGDIYPCSLVAGEKRWLIGKTSEGLYQEKIQMVQDLNKKNTDSCVGCNFYDFCPSSRCKLINEKITGDFYKASAITCLQSRVMLEMMEMIY
ncbi:uncharacterized protein C8E03_102153 [Lachnotalea glycerini]|uniref:Radical SAM core domain-containing protein n=1 Tax=Lachnotalea glycerini TaxID=1763509 RepID=A0A318EPI9_9FIRM|nr:radical SAM protein [Lachnotalea glycerini]PXV93385.1 uncharacterized protein C8E03_102153 [Lachnotalea glycerini]